MQRGDNQFIYENMSRGLQRPARGSQITASRAGGLSTPDLLNDGGLSSMLPLLSTLTSSARPTGESQIRIPNQSHGLPAAYQALRPPLPTASGRGTPEASPFLQ